MERCPRNDDDVREQCAKKCENIFDEYVQSLEKRYDESPEKLDVVVRNSPIYTTKRRPDRQGLFYDVFGQSFDDMMGRTKPPTTTPNQEEAKK